MLQANIEQNGKTKVDNIFVIDAHSHLGQDVDGAAMMNPLAPSGTFDFWGNVQGKIQADWEKTGEQSFETTINGKRSTIHWSFRPFPFTDKLYHAIEKLGRKHSDLREKAKFYSFIDQGVCFPFQDTFRDKRPEALYRSSNMNIARFTTRFPFSMKLIGYCRVDPSEKEKAVNEVKHSREVLGLRGLKLHPRSEGWVDEVTKDVPIPVLLEAAKHSMPIIFDTRGKRTIVEIGQLVQSTRNIIKTKYPDLLPHFKVIIAHFAQGNIGDHDVYNTIVQPNVYGDLSMLHGEGAANFFEDFQRWFKTNNKIQVDGRDWSEYLLFATDYPYFGDVHAEKLLIEIINKHFFDAGGTIQDTKNILGLNQIKLLPEYNLAIDNGMVKNKPSTMVSNPAYEENKISAYDISIQALANLIVSNKIDINKFCLQFEGTFNEFNRDILLMITNTNTKEELNLYFKNIVEDRINLVGTIGNNLTWNKFGYKFFNPNDRKLFSRLFTRTYLATSVDQAIENISAIIS
ncbi:MAG: hypothetical protein GF383_15405 [Candidatus Lokiarchaeota archaeon]|nr:hypothetical protein [Candidatus Lokiarchaeota archaeon]MBD3342930.1 hypothetical protein [Candidatus Lokiarchaeota archaeon]